MQIRKEILQIRKNLSDEEREYRSSLACERLYQQVKTDVVLCYYPLKDEINLLPLYNKLLADGKKLFFPVTDGDEMIFYRVNSLEDFSEGAFHVMEPIDRAYDVRLETLMFGEVDRDKSEGGISNKVTCITPGAVFDKAGNRMGYGKGYYDRFFAKIDDKTCEVFKIAVAYNFQIVEAIDTNPWDVKMDRVIEV